MERNCGCCAAPEGEVFRKKKEKRVEWLCEKKKKKKKSSGGGDWKKGRDALAVSGTFSRVEYSFSTPPPCKSATVHVRQNPESHPKLPP